MTRKGRCTIGDDMQLLAIENLYKYMGIDYNEVVRIPFSELSTYSGEYVILPLSFPFYGYSNGINITNFSPKIDVYKRQRQTRPSLDRCATGYAKCTGRSRDTGRIYRNSR